MCGPRIALFISSAITVVQSFRIRKKTPDRHRPLELGVA